MKRIFLIGYMGAGKTTVGKDLSERMGLSFIDLDSYIESRYHKTVRQIFEEKGEEAFRKIERTVLQGVALFENVIVSTGGGAPAYYDNMEFMNRKGTTVYLQVSVEELANRLEVCKHTRPVLKNHSGKELKAFIAENLRKREPFYKKATVIFDAENMLSETDVQNISQALEKLV
ncbi:MAG: shikimate kinase [Tannerellaceae bacterium]|nr:shikimate kinase [Tannerellaceae bacterium]